MKPGAPAEWTAVQRIAFRFAFCYFAAYVLAECAVPRFIPEGAGVGEPYFKLWGTFFSWTAANVFHLPSVARLLGPGIGGSLFRRIFPLAILAVSIVAAVLWSVFDRNRSEYRRLHSWLRVFLRINLSLVLFSYAIDKLLLLQFAPPGFSDLIVRLGDLSPMNLLWIFMGVSPAYTIFAGMAELTGGILLLFRRTALLGALVSLGALTNVAALDFAYGVTVSMYALNLVLRAVFIVVPDIPRLADFFLLNKATLPVELSSPEFAPNRLRVSVVKTLFVCGVILGMIGIDWSQRSEFAKAEGFPLAGLYEVDRFVRDGTDAPPLTTDATRWRRVAVENGSRLWVEMMDDSLERWETSWASSGSGLVLAARSVRTGPHNWVISQPGPDRVILNGRLDGHPVLISLHRIGTAGFRLTKR